MKRHTIIIKRTLSALLAGVMLVGLAACTRKNRPSGSAKPADASYAETLFDDSFVHTINVELADEDWEDLTKNPLEKTKYAADITIDGEKVSNVSFSTKGNTSLTAVAGDKDSDRYSFKVNFGKYEKGQTYRGLNKLSLNNIYADATYMKDYLSYELFRRVGVTAPLVSYVMLSINGKEHGLYIAIEDVGKSLLERTADGEGVLYKPETEQLSNMTGGKTGGNGNGPGPGGQPPQQGGQPGGQGGFPGGQGGFPGGQGGFPGGQPPQMPEGSERPEMPGGMDRPGEGWPGGMGGDDKGASLRYTDDELSSYSDIFDNAETSADDAAKLRVIAALKGLSEGTDIEKYVDTDEVIRYFAAHNFVLSYDSYTGVMLHNYYLYENEGRLSMLPWDYNLAFGAFSGQGKDVTALINTGVDTPLSGATEEQRPMWGFIAGSEERLAEYHEVYSGLIESFFDSGEFEKEIDSLYNMLLPYVKKDPSAFFTADEFKTAVENLKRFCLLRAESIKKQLSGELSSKTDEQDASARVDASDVDISAMGSHSPGGQGGPNGSQGMTPPEGMTPPDGQTPPNGQTPPDGQTPPSGSPGRPPQATDNP